MKNPLKNILILIILIIFTSQVGAQSLITGRVVDDETKEPIADVAVSIEGKEAKAVSNFKGFFQIEGNEKDNLILNAESYHAKSVLLTTAKSVQISLHRKVILPYEGGEAEFYKFLGNSLRYPKEARDIQREGVVYITFMADTSGAISKFKVFSDIGRGCGEEVVRVLRKMPDKWTVKEPTKFILPVTFRMERDNFPHLKKEELPAGKLMTEMIVTGYEIRR